jgi:GTPase SAR1 family protein
LGDDPETKEHFIRKCWNKYFNPSERLTIGVDFYTKTLESHEKKVILQMWDVGGDERFKFLLPTYFLGANGAILISDLIKTESLSDIYEWIEDLRRMAGAIPIIFVNIQKPELSERSVFQIHILKSLQNLGLEIYSESSIETEFLLKDLITLMIERFECDSQPDSIISNTPKNLNQKGVNLNDLMKRLIRRFKGIK